MIKLLTLNLWGYNDWNSRLKNITHFINQTDADVVALQEVQQDSSFSKIPQSESLAKQSKYKYGVFVPTCKKPSLSKRGVFADHGLAILSKFEIKNVHLLLLEKQIPEHEQCGALYVQIKFGIHEVAICNVHFHNTDTTSILHLKEVQNYFDQRQLKPIIIGDFNIYNLNKYRNLLLNYDLSTDYVDYTSFIKDGGTLDYVTVPSEEYSISGVGTSKSYVSDHKAVWARLSIKTRDNDKN